MAQRPTRRAGLYKTRHQDPKLQKALDAIIERIEVLDGLRGDSLDRAVTFRSLQASGFTVSGGGYGGSGTPIIDGGGPGGGGGGDGPGIGPPSGAPSNLTVAETWLALQLTWSSPSFNTQHIEIWRSDETTLGGTGDPADDNVSLATRIGATTQSVYMDYVGGRKAYFYWIRALGTDGTYSAFNAVAGTYGETGIDPSDWEFNLTIAGENLNAALAARIDLIDIDGLQDSLMTRVAAAEGNIVAIDLLVTELESDVTGLDLLIAGNTTLIDANATLISTQQTSITTLTNAVDTLNGTTAANTGNITVNASDILNLKATVGALDAEGGQTWEFLTDLDGFTANNASIVHSGAGTGSIVFTPSGADPSLVSETIDISGGIYSQVVARVKRVTSGGTWEGAVTYSTGGHTATSSYIKTIPDPNLVQGAWTTLTWDMSTLDAGGQDWVNSIIQSIRLDLVSDNAGKFEIDWIIIAKFSTSAISDALAALDVRVTANEGGISAQATDIVALESTVNNSITGVTATSNAVSALTTDVESNTAGVSANAGQITLLKSTVNDPATGVEASASAISQLETEVDAVDGVLTAQSSDITQLVARMSGGYTSLVNSLTKLNENFGTTYSTAQIQSYNVGNRNGVAARINTAGNVVDYVNGADGVRIIVNPNDVVEVKFSVYHNKPNDAGSFYAGLELWPSTSGGVRQAMRAINNRVAGTSTNNPYWLKFSGANHNAEWLDVTCYILGENVDPALCPNMIINGESAPTGFDTFNDGFQARNGYKYVRLRFLNYNSSPTYGDGTTTTSYVTNLSFRRIDGEASNYAAIQVEATATADSVGNLEALYAVKVELNSGGVPYVSGFGLASAVIDGTASSAFGIRADQFFIQHPNASTETSIPFGIGLVTDGEGNSIAEVGIKGSLIVDGTIRGDKIFANTIGADKINVNTLSALAVDTGVLVVDRLTTGQDGTSPLYTDQSSWRVEIEGVAPGTQFPIWYGQGAKSAPNGLFYVQANGTVVVKGLLDAGMIKQSYFTPAGGNNSFRIACDYPSNYSGGIYTGKAAHLSPILTTGYTPPKGLNRKGVNIIATSPASASSSISQLSTGYFSDPLTFYSPTHNSTTEYARLGTMSETLAIRYAASLYHDKSDFAGWIILQYRYDQGTWKNAYVLFSQAARGGRLLVMNSEDIFITRELAWDTIDIRLAIGAEWYDTQFIPPRGWTQSVNLTVQTANFGYADLASSVVIDQIDGATTNSQTILRDATAWRQYI
jgi:hypothetical protein